MVIALLAVLGVDLIVIVAILVLVLGCKRWVTRQPGAFRGVIRVTSGDVDGLGAKWRRGYGHNGRTRQRPSFVVSRPTRTSISPGRQVLSKSDSGGFARVGRGATW